MNTTTTYTCLLIPVVACSISSFADPMAAPPHRAPMELQTAALGNAISYSDALVSPGVGAGVEQYGSSVVGTTATFTDYFLWEEPGYFLRAVFFPSAGQRESSHPPIVPEPSTWILVLLGLGILLATQHSVPVNLRTVHSRLRARRGHAPIR